MRGLEDRVIEARREREREREKKVILGEERGKKKYSLKDARAASASLLMAVGAAFAIIGIGGLLG